MEFTIERDELLEALQLTQGIVERRTTIPILANVLIESKGDGIILSATDQEVGLRRLCSAKVKRKGALTAGARKLYEVVRECPEGSIAMRTLENNWIELSAQKSRFKMVGLDPKEFPAMPHPVEGQEQQAVAIPVLLLQEMIERTQFAMSFDESRANLGGIFLERPEEGRLRLVATDGHRLSMITRAVPEAAAASGVILPRKGVSEIGKVIEGGDEAISLTLQGGVAHVSRGGVDLSLRLLEGEFPDYHQVIPAKSEHKMVVEASALLAALRRVSVLSSERTKGVKFQVDRERLEISSVSPDVGEASEELSVEYDGAAFGIGFNAKYFIDALSVLAADTQVQIGLNDEVSPAVLRCEGDPDYLYVVMPMRL